MFSPDEQIRGNPCRSEAIPYISVLKTSPRRLRHTEGFTEESRSPLCRHLCDSSVEASVSSVVNPTAATGKDLWFFNADSADFLDGAARLRLEFLNTDWNRCAALRHRFSQINCTVASRCAGDLGSHFAPSIPRGLALSRRANRWKSVPERSDSVYICVKKFTTEATPHRGLHRGISESLVTASP